jgi:hypothetical protein
MAFSCVILLISASVTPYLVAAAANSSGAVGHDESEWG